MLQILPVLIFYVFLSAIFLFEGLGIQGGREISFYIILVMPFFLFFLQFIQKKEIVVPKKLSIVYILFILFSALATFISINTDRSFSYLLFYISLFLIFNYVLNNTEAIKKYIIPYIFGLSFLLTIYSVFLKYLIQNNIWSLIPEHGYQFVFPKFGLHNHLGDFLILPLTICSYYLVKGKSKLLPILGILFFIPFLIFSYSRSAYVSVILTCFLLFFAMKRAGQAISKKFIVAIACIIVVLASFFLFTMSETQVFKSDVVEKKMTLTPRLNFFYDAVRSMIDSPFGVGPNNYVYISGKYSQLTRYFSYSSHNIFFDVLVENGIFASVFFIYFIYLIIKRSDDTSVIFFCFLATLINFQTDYTHNIYSYILLFFVLMALVYRQKKIVYSKIILLFAFLLFLATQYIYFSRLIL